MPASAARRRYRWFVLLSASAILLVWTFLPADQDGTTPSGGTSPTPGLTRTSTPSSDPTSTEPESTDPASGLPIVRLAHLPPEAAETLGLIDAGGPFPEDRDGATFQNREDLLPERPMGYYREYTVPTPGSEDRGARRIVAGKGGELYWTGDHYSSFSRIAR